MALGQRQQLHKILETFADHVYFQPPTNVNLVYPCIIYNRDYVDTKFADDHPYDRTVRYMITIIDRDPDSDIPGKVGSLPMSLYNRFYTADDLNHDVYVVYF